MISAQHTYTYIIMDHCIFILTRVHSRILTVVTDTNCVDSRGSVIESYAGIQNGGETDRSSPRSISPSSISHRVSGAPPNETPVVHGIGAHFDRITYGRNRLIMDMWCKHR